MFQAGLVQDNKITIEYSEEEMLKKVIICLLLPGLIAANITGCGNMKPQSIGQMNGPERIDYSSYQKTLSAYVCDGLVRYKKLKDDSAELDEFILSLECTGPSSTPNLFTDPDQTLAFWINIYNAAALHAAVERYPVKSVQRPWRNFEKSQMLRVDGRRLTLEQIAELARQAGYRDPRIEIALTLPAKGSPQLSAEVFQGPQIDQQLDQAMSRAIGDPSQAMIDHEGKTIRLGSAIYRVREKLIEAYCRKNKTTSASIVNALAEFGDATQRRRLNAAIGYRVAEITFDWSLNEKEEPPCSLVQ